MILDLSSLEDAVKSFQSALQIAAPANLQQFDEETQDVIKAGVIQNFEFTYELSHKMLRRYLDLTEPNPAGIDTLSFPDLIRLGSERGLLKSGWDTWRYYRKARGTTSHTYDRAKAAEVLSAAAQFIAEARFLLEQLESRNRADH
jgi:nucleotidyltransferase substrate binding protein (TIGR01987 family)